MTTPVENNVAGGIRFNPQLVCEIVESRFFIVAIDIAEFIELNPGVYVLGLKEGSILKIEESRIELLGAKDTKVFMKGMVPVSYSAKDSLQFLL